MSATRRVFKNGDNWILQLGEHARVQIFQKGAHVTHWQDSNGIEQLYMSPTATFDKGTAIRGGIPVIFPQFADNGPLPKHGFVRSSDNWICTEHGSDTDNVWIVFSHVSDESTKQVWNFDFEFDYKVTLFDNGNQLKCEARVRNNSPIDSVSSAGVQVCFHTYFALPSGIDNVQVHGLKGNLYVDKVNDSKEFKEEGDNVSIAGEVDRVYKNVNGDVFIQDTQTNKKLVIERENLDDIVVWNPWIGKAKSIGDLPDDGYKHFICVETGQIASPYQLSSQQTISCSQVLRASL